MIRLLRDGCERQFGARYRFMVFRQERSHKHVYKKIEISGFRGINKIALDKLGQINILTGKNNAGKSSCLEAISLLSSGSRVFQNAFGENSLEQILRKRIGGGEGWNYLTHVDSVEARIVGHGENESATDMLAIGESPYDLNPPPEAELIERLQSRVHRTLDSDETVDNQMFFYFRGKNRVLGTLYMTRGGLRSAAQPHRELSGAVAERQFMLTDSACTADDLYDRLAESRKLHDVIEKVRKKLPEITDIRQVRNVLYVYQDGRPVPFHLTGDGFQTALKITMMVNMPGRGIMVLEEPENRMHPGLVFHMIDEMLSACKDGEIQFFISSHSDELIKCALDMQTDADISVHNLYRLDDEVCTESFDRQQAKEHRLELKFDLRGL